MKTTVVQWFQWFGEAMTHALGSFNDRHLQLEMAVVERTQGMGHRFTEPLEPLNNRCFHHVLRGLSSV